MDPCHCIVGRSSESFIEFGNHQLLGETFGKTVWICNFKQWHHFNWRGCSDQNDTRWVIHETVHQIEVGCWITVYGLQHYTYQWYPWWDYSLASLLSWEIISSTCKFFEDWHTISIHIYTRYTCDKMLDLYLNHFFSPRARMILLGNWVLPVELVAPFDLVQVWILWA